MRILEHLFSGPWQARRRFQKAAMQRIGEAIASSERSHAGELRFVVEAGLHWHNLLCGMTARQRAVEVFSQLKVWDTEQNSGVLIYLLLADHDVEIIADRGIHARVGMQGWQEICHVMEQRFRAGEFERGVLEGVDSITQLLRQHFPSDGDTNPNELPDSPVVL
jgi:uncharacterized membrane protein